MIDLTALNKSIGKIHSVTFKDGGAFNFNDNISLNTIRIKDADQPTSPFPGRTASLAPIVRSFLTRCSAASEATMDTRVEDLETSVDQLLSDTAEINKLLRENNKDKSKASFKKGTPAFGSGEDK